MSSLLANNNSMYQMITISIIEKLLFDNNANYSMISQERL